MSYINYFQPQYTNATTSTNVFAKILFEDQSTTNNQMDCDNYPTNYDDAVIDVTDSYKEIESVRIN